ncbi:MAG TPA: DinB family protein [Chitinophagaceae bacterium]|nr:DinB family protein [Chitinophagaceae bacterium]
MTDIAPRLSEHIVNIPLLFNTFSQEKLLHRPAPGKWSKKEILGHLIDSAINNLKRFTEIQGQEGIYVLRPYPQDLLVAANHYQESSLPHLLQLWQSLNRQIVFVIENIPPTALDYLVDINPQKQDLRTLEWLIKDYVVHMEHHLSQIVK